MIVCIYGKWANLENGHKTAVKFDIFSFQNKCNPISVPMAILCGDIWISWLCGVCLHHQKTNRIALLSKNWTRVLACECNTCTCTFTIKSVSFLSAMNVRKRRKKKSWIGVADRIGKQYLTYYKISSSAYSANTVCKLGSEGGLESEGTGSAPYHSGETPSLWPVNFNKTTDKERLAYIDFPSWSCTQNCTVSQPSLALSLSLSHSLLNSKCYSLIFSILSLTSSIIHRR